jgi:hypothetical protein
MVVTRRSARWSSVATVLLCLAALAPFVPDAWAFTRLGIPDVLFTGDGAMLELGTLHAANGVQLVGPYSRFGWSHPGPLFFYLALPIYEIFERRGPALNLFAFLANGVVAVALVLTARQLRGSVFALAMAAFLALFGLVGLPFLLANEWNPILPILPLALLCFLTVRLSLGVLNALPQFAFVASAVVQTHVGYAPAVFVLCVFIFVSHRRGLRTEPSINTRPPTGRWIASATITVLMVCWALPLYEVFVDPPGNLTRLVGFFAFRTSLSHPWRAVLTTVTGQMAVMPWALVQALAQRPLAAPGAALAAGIALMEVVGLVALLAAARRRSDPVVRMLAKVTLVLVGVAVVAVQAIRADILFYLVAWVSLTGFLFLVTATAWLVPTLEEAVGLARARAAVVLSAVALGALALAGPVPRSAVTRQSDARAEELARGVENYLRVGGLSSPTVHIVSREIWPTAVAVVLHLYKANVPVYVEREWLNIVGKAFAEPPGQHPGLFFGDPAFADWARLRPDFAPVAHTDRVSVFLGSAP